ncbi:YozE family protein [Macrococcus armenti]|uniref:YozE family protein n=1 Tax=Macrococcus armenti TaxID=2875764 RepID=UPI001CCF4479|nr:YozE family protein [Macrococcus armenti]UBH16579.1 sterile alpha motif-like domain-containing protein [Macrococcus armenti]UBH21214.1 sterile alpha motif-like domain-containing protein [Macrococcus armenti]
MYRYKTWMKQFIGSDTPLGDLAVDINNDKEFPKKNNKKYLENYLATCNASPEALDVFNKSWSLYENYNQLYINPYKQIQEYLNKNIDVLFVVIDDNKLIGIFDEINDLEKFYSEDEEQFINTYVYILPLKNVNNYSSKIIDYEWIEKFSDNHGNIEEIIDILI